MGRTGWGTGKVATPTPTPPPPLPTLERHRGFPRFFTSLSSLIRCVTNNTLGGMEKTAGEGGEERGRGNGGIKQQRGR